MAKDLSTTSHVFDCDYCVPFNGPKRQLFVRIPSEQFVEAATALSDPGELSGLSFCGQPVPGFTRLASLANEGAQYFFVLEE
jgi:hypothetical protein